MTDKRFIEGINTGIKMVQKWMKMADSEVELNAMINASLLTNKTLLDDMKPDVRTRKRTPECEL